MKAYPIPSEAYDDRLAIVGTAGSGKTYAVLGAMARLLESNARLIGIDPLGAMWGLRLDTTGKKPSPFNVVIFGGKHGDIAINDRSGAVIGETVATMRESCIIDLSLFGTKAAERRFMYHFLAALYRHTPGNPLHLIIDEADMWAPQRLMDKEGDAAKLLGMMETIVRRGRIKGFVPWLITQRPAVLSKDVLSQADGVIALKLTSSQDRGAIGKWVESTADSAAWKETDRALPSYQRGEGILWIPGRSIFKSVAFPENQTFDSSRTPKRGEKRQATELKPLDLGALKGKLASVEEEAKANDPKALKAEISRLNAELTKAAKGKAPVQDETAALRDREAAFAAGKKEGHGAGYLQGWADGEKYGFNLGVVAMDKEITHTFNRREIPEHQPSAPPKKIPAPVQNGTPNITQNIPAPTSSRAAAPKVAISNPAGPVSNLDGMTPALQRVLDGVAWWAVAGDMAPARKRIAVLAGLSPKASTLGVYIAKLAQMGLVETGIGTVQITDAGRDAANHPDAATREDLRQMARQMLSPAEDKILEIVYAAYPDGLPRPTIAERAGLSPKASTLGVYIARCAAHGFVETAPGSVRAADWLFPEGC